MLAVFLACSLVMGQDITAAMWSGSLRRPKFARTFPSRDEDVSTGLVGNSSSRPCMRIDGGREANAAVDYSDSAVRSWSE